MKSVRYMKICLKMKEIHCVKSVRVRSYFGFHFPAFELNTERYGYLREISLRVQSKCRKIRSRITPNTDTFDAVILFSPYESVLADPHPA